MATPIPKNAAPISAWDLAGFSQRLTFAGSEARRARGVVIDSRAAFEGCAFVALKGENFDGNDYVQQAIDAGAHLVVTEREIVSDRADVVVVDGTLLALGHLATSHLRQWRRSRRAHDPGRVIAITGSAGKTTTKQIAAALANSVGETLATPGNLNNRIGVPMTVFLLEPHHRFAVLEIGMSIRGEIASLAAIVQPDIAIITNIGVAHAAGVGGNRVGVAIEKGALYQSLARDGVAIVNADDDAARASLARTNAQNALFFGQSEDADYRLISLTQRGFEGTRFTFTRPCADCLAPGAKETLEVDSPLVGEVAAIDFLAALAAVEAARGAPLESSAIQSAMRTLENASQRGDVIDLDDGTVVIDDTYNANPHSVIAALGILRTLAKNQSRRSVAILGEMKELGDGEREEHLAIGSSLVGVDCVIGCGGLIDLTLGYARDHGVKVIAGNDVDEAIAAALREVKPNDLVLVKASRSVGAERVIHALKNARNREKEPR